MIRRSKNRITKDGMLFERRLIALRRLQRQQPLAPTHQPSQDEIQDSRSRWSALKTWIRDGN